MSNAFPRLRITRDHLAASGAFAESQAAYLQPDTATVAELDALLHSHNVGVVAHFYMDPELQGVLAACSWPHIQISDSLVMADRAVKMAAAGVAAIAVAGVDFMSENVRAVMDAAGFAHVPVYRLARERIGCSLAEAAEADAYGAFLRQASRQPQSLHVVYINTSLRTKALADQLVPTITCTSSNVIQTILQAAAQLPDVHIWYGPDSYMGENLQTMLQAYAQLDEAAVRRLHPEHTPATIAALLKRFHYFGQGHCVVHHLFGHEVVQRVQHEHAHALITAHLEVPGEMFHLAIAAQREGRGVVGSTSNILDFILAEVGKRRSGTVEFVLGTEAGMITSIVRGVQAALQSTGSDLAVDIVFPVASEVVATTGDATLPIVPASAGGEGCSTSGGCATCPYMKMNHLDALIDVVRAVGHNDQRLQGLRPQLDPRPVDGQPVAVRGGVPILHMRAFQRSGTLPDTLVSDVQARQAT